MTDFIGGYGRAADWREALSQACAPIRASSPRPNLGFIYISDAMAAHLAEAYALLVEQTGVPHWVGTIGMGIIGTDEECYDEPGVSLLAGRFPEGSFEVLATDTAHPCNATRYFGIVHADPRTSDVPERIRKLSAEMQEGFLVGGIASSRTQYGLIADGVVNRGIAGVLFSPDVAVSTRLTQGCSPIGPRHRVTAAQANLILELDSRPALEVFKEDIGEVLARDIRRTAGYIHAALPIVGSDSGDYLVRNLVGIDSSSGAIAIAEQVAEGMALMFCRRDATTARRDLKRMLAALKGTLRSEPKAALYYSCLARGINLFGPDSAELSSIQAELGSIPLAGFFANGEISYNRLYAYTGVLTVFT